mmetsp:Transcript_18639/g.22867  ORF Transcript_18639/g.22867 Transcript_18639/m.22867 type:complete len:1392 (+) Transcript_18639:345-4520(+)
MPAVKKERNCARRYIVPMLLLLLILAMPALGFVLITLGIAAQEQQREVDLFSDFSKLTGDCTILSSNFTSRSSECFDAGPGSSRVCRCTYYYVFSFVANEDDNSNSSTVVRTHTSVEVPHNKSRSNYCLYEPVPPRWDEGEIVDCYEPNVPQDPRPEYSCGNPDCIKIYWDFSKERLANLLKILGVCASCIGGTSWLVVCCFVPLCRWARATKDEEVHDLAYGDLENNEESDFGMRSNDLPGGVREFAMKISGEACDFDMKIPDGAQNLIPREMQEKPAFLNDLTVTTDNAVKKPPPAFIECDESADDDVSLSTIGMHGMSSRELQTILKKMMAEEMEKKEAKERGSVGLTPVNEKEGEQKPASSRRILIKPPNPERHRKRAEELRRKKSLGNENFDDQKSNTMPPVSNIDFNHKNYDYASNEDDDLSIGEESAEAENEIRMNQMEKEKIMNKIKEAEIKERKLQELVDNGVSIDFNQPHNRPQKEEARTIRKNRPKIEPPHSHQYQEEYNKVDGKGQRPIIVPTQKIENTGRIPFHDSYLEQKPTLSNSISKAMPASSLRRLQSSSFSKSVRFHKNVDFPDQESDSKRAADDRYVTGQAQADSLLPPLKKDSSDDIFSLPCKPGSGHSDEKKIWKENSDGNWVSVEGGELNSFAIENKPDQFTDSIRFENQPSKKSVQLEIDLNNSGQVNKMPHSPDDAWSMLNLLDPNICDVVFVMSVGKQFPRSAHVVAKVLEILRNASLNAGNKASIINVGGTDLISQWMWDHMGDAMVQEYACGAIFALSSDSNMESKTSITNGGCIDAILLCALQPQFQSENVQIWACGALSSLSHHENKRDVCVSSSGAAQSIFSMLEAGRKLHITPSPLMLEWAIRTLVNLDITSYNNDGCSQYVIGTFISLMSSDFCHASLHYNICVLICQLSSISSLIPSIVSQGGVKGILHTMKAHVDNVHIQQRCCAIFANLACDEAAVSEVADKNIVHHLLVTMSKHLKNLEFQEHACIVLARLAVHDRIVHTLLGDPATDIILRAMQIHCNSSILYENASVCITLLYKGKPDAFSNYMPSIFALIASNIVSNHNQEPLCVMMASLASDAYIRAENSMVEGVKAVITMMENCPTNANVQKMGCMALRNMSMSENTLGSQTLLENVLQIIFVAMKSHEENAHVQAEGCGAVWSISCYSRNGLDYINRSIRSIITAVQVHQDAQVEEQACGALWSLCVLDHRNKFLIRSMGGIEAIVCAMYICPDSLDFLENVCGLLSTLTENVECANALYSQGIIDVMLETMRNHANVASIQQYGCLAIRNMAAGSNELALALNCSINLIVHAMQKHATAPKVQEEACGALWSLAANANVNKGTIVSADGINVISAAMDGNCGEEAACAFAELANFNLS